MVDFGKVLCSSANELQQNYRELKCFFLKRLYSAKRPERRRAWRNGFFRWLERRMTSKGFVAVDTVFIDLRYSIYRLVISASVLKLKYIKLLVTDSIYR